MANVEGENIVLVAALHAEFAEVIATWPLYRELKYAPRRFVTKPREGASFASLAKTINLFCDDLPVQPFSFSLTTD